MQYGLSEKSAGAVKTVLAAAGVVLDALEKNIAENENYGKPVPSVSVSLLCFHSVAAFFLLL